MRERKTTDAERMLARAARLAMCYDWRRRGEATDRWRLPAHVRAFLGRLFRVPVAERDRILDLAEQAHRQALEDGTFAAGRADRQSALGLRSGARRRAAVAARDREIVRRLDAGESQSAIAADIGCARATVTSARDRLARARP